MPGYSVHPLVARCTCGVCPSRAADAEIEWIFNRPRSRRTRGRARPRAKRQSNSLSLPSDKEFLYSAPIRWFIYYRRPTEEFFITAARRSEKTRTTPQSSGRGDLVGLGNVPARQRTNGVRLAGLFKAQSAHDLKDDRRL